MNSKLQKITNISKEELQELVNKTSSKRDILRILISDKIPHGTYCKALNEMIEKLSIDMKEFNSRSIEQKKKQIGSCPRGRRFTTEQMLVVNPPCGTGAIKDRILQDNVIEYKCEKCGNTGNWNGQELVLQLDHRNGNNQDNRKVNLRFLCPNCHTQTDTFASRNRNPRKCSCGKKIHRTSTCCESCNRIRLDKRKFNPSYDELKQMLVQHDNNLTKVGEVYSVSANAIKKRAIRLNLYTKKERKLG